MDETREKSIPALIAKFEDLITGLQGNVNEIEKALTPVMQSESPSPSCAEKLDQREQCNLGGSLLGLMDRVSAASNALASCLGRLEI